MFSPSFCAFEAATSWMRKPRHDFQKIVIFALKLQREAQNAPQRNRDTAAVKQEIGGGFAASNFLSHGGNVAVSLRCILGFTVES